MVVVIAAVFGSTAFAGEVSIVLLQSDGKVQFSANRGESWQSFGKKSSVRETDQIRADGIADFRVEGNSLIRLFPQTVIRVKKNLPKGEGTQVGVFLIKGRMVGSAQVSKEFPKVEFFTPMAGCIVSNKAAFDASPNGLVQCIGGELVVIYLVGRKAPPVTLSAGKRVQPAGPPTGGLPFEKTDIPKEDLVLLQRTLEELTQAGTKPPSR